MYNTQNNLTRFNHSGLELGSSYARFDIFQIIRSKIKCCTFFQTFCPFLWFWTMKPHSQYGTWEYSMHHCLRQIKTLRVSASNCSKLFGIFFRTLFEYMSPCLYLSNTCIVSTEATGNYTYSCYNGQVFLRLHQKLHTVMLNKHLKFFVLQ